MGFDLDYSRGVLAISEVYEAEVARQRAAAEKLRAYRQRDLGVPPDLELQEELYAALEPERPVWWRIMGIHPWRGNAGLEERRAGIVRLLLAVEAMYRAELSLWPARVRASGGSPDTNPTSAHFYDPLREICHFLQLPMSKLSQLCLEQTGLRMHEMGDVIRAEGVRARLKGLFEPLIPQWEATVDEKARAKWADPREKAWAFLKWVRGRGRAGNRKKLAWEFGVPSAARLEKAVYMNTDLTLEELEIAVVMELLAPPVEQVLVGTDCAQSAGLSDVGAGVEKEAEPARGDAPGARLGDVGAGAATGLVDSGAVLGSVA